MLNKKIVLISCSLILMFFTIILALAFPVYRNYSKIQDLRSERIARLKLLLCEDAKLGMTKEQVIGILEQKGKLQINGNYDEPTLGLDIVYTDPFLNEYYGRFYVVIDDYKYVSSSISTGFESYQTICSLEGW